MSDEETIFEQALGIAAAPAREEFLRSACAGNEAVFERLQGLLRAHDRAGKFLEPKPNADGSEPAAAPLVVPLLGGAALGSPQGGTPSLLTEQPGDRIGRYKLLQKIGEGGCGVVYMAEQEEPVRRRVALKIIKLGMDTRQVIARFEAERQALAMMDHPNIAKVFDAGVTGSAESPIANFKSRIQSGRPYFVMELVRGVKITEYCDEKKLSTPERLELFMEVCRAVQHAHQKGIIHRDLKPSNILVSVNDGVGVPKVIDFGIAKATTGEPLTDKTVFTAFDQFIGTPAYMSPEQALVTSLDIDTRTDIYSLGVLLYELLTGQTPFDPKELMEQGLEAIRRAICEREPQRPSTRLSTISGEVLSTTAQRRGLDAPKLLSQLRGDLDWIVMKCLEKDRARRYETANGLATDIQRHLNNEPVLACPPSSLYRIQKLVRRNKLAVAAATAVTTALLLGLGFSTLMFLQERKARLRAVTAEGEAEKARTNEARLRALADAARSNEVILRLEAETARTQEGLLRVQADVARNNEVRLRLDAEAARTNEAQLRLQAQSDEKKAQTEAAKSQQVARFLEEMLDGVGPAVALGEDTKLLRGILDKTVKRIGKDLRNQPEVEAELRSTIGNVYQQLGLFEDASAMHRSAVGIYRSLPDPHDHSLVEALKHLANSLISEGKLSEAETNAMAAVALARQLPDRDHLAGSLTALAFVLQPQGRVREAAALLRQVVDLRKSAHESNGEQFAGSLNNLAMALRDLAETRQAEKLLREALEMATNSVPSDHPLVAQTLNNLGTILLDQHRSAEAELLLRRALEMTRKLHTEGDHPDYAVNLGNLAKSLVDQRKFSEAEDLFRQTLEKMKKTLPAKHQHIATALNNSAYILSLTTDPAKLTESASLFQEALDMQREVLGETNQAVALSLNNLAGVLNDLGRRSESLAMLREALQKWRNVYGDEHPLVSKTCGNLARALMHDKKYDEALQLCNDLLPVDLENRPQRANLLMTRLEVLARRGRWHEAAADAAKIVAMASDHRAQYGHLLTLLQLADGNQEGARQTCRQMLKRFAETNDPNAAVRMAVDCLIIPPSGIEIETVARLTDSAVARSSKNVFYQFCKGLAEYRHGRFTNAVGWMTQPLESHQRSWDDRLHIQSYCVVALAHGQLKHPDEAKVAWAKALKLVETALPKVDSGDLGSQWQDWIISQALLKETKTLIESLTSERN